MLHAHRIDKYKLNVHYFIPIIIPMVMNESRSHAILCGSFHKWINYKHVWIELMMIIFITN